MKIGLASDHRGYTLKEEIIKDLEKEYEIIDYGTTSKESVDYPDFAFKLGEGINQHDIEYGIAICGSGIGMSIACNKVKGVRCAKVNSKEDVIVTRQDNDANVIAFGEKVSKEDALDWIHTFINTPCSKEEKHVRRRNKIKEYEEQSL